MGDSKGDPKNKMKAPLFVDLSREPMPRKRAALLHNALSKNTNWSTTEGCPISSGLIPEHIQ